MTEIFKPSPEDYKAVQGGEPKVEWNDDLSFCRVIHDYPAGQGLIVPTDIKSIRDMRTILKLIGDRVVEFPTVLLREFHGLPCEQRSSKLRGKTYDRGR